MFNGPISKTALSLRQSVDRAAQTIVRNSRILGRTLVFALTFSLGISTSRLAGQDRYATTVQRLQQSAGLYCEAETYDERRCGAVITELRGLDRANPGHRDATELLARSLWTASFFAQPPAQQDRNRRESLALFRKLVVEQPNDARLKLELSRRTEDQNERLRLLLETASVKDATPSVHRDLAVMLLARGRVQPAYQQYSEFLASLKDPEREDAMNGVQFALQLASRGGKYLSVAILKDLLKRTRSAGPEEQCYAFRPVNIQEYENDPELQSELRRLVPYCTNLEHRNEAVLLQLQGHIPEAIREIKLQIETNPQYAEAYSILASLYQLDHQPEEAVKVAEQFLRGRKDGAVEVCASINSGRTREIGNLGIAFAEELRRACVRRGY